MSDHVKYTFDKAFDGGHGARTDEEIARLRIEAEEAKTTAYDTGFQDGLAQAKAELEAQILALTQQAMASVQSLLAERQQLENKLSDHAVVLAHTIAGKLSDAARDAYPLAEIEKLLADCMDAVFDEPSLRLSVSPQLVGPAEKRLSTFLKNMQFEGNLSVIADDQLSGSDCVLNWSDGAARSQLGMTAAKISRLLDNHLRGPQTMADIEHQKTTVLDKETTANIDSATELGEDDIQAADTTADMGEDVPQDVSEHVPDDIPSDVPDDVSSDVPDDVSSDVSVSAVDAEAESGTTPADEAGAADTTEFEPLDLISGDSIDGDMSATAP